MAMISGGDESARNAFRAYLRDDASSSQVSIASTEEMTAADVLEVKNLAYAIERAERALRESSRPRDMFAELGSDRPPKTLRSPPEILTDDASGPAVYARPTPTPPPPRPVAATQPLPILMVPNEEDAFLQPGGRMRHFAEETLDGYRPDSTSQVRQIRLGARRKTFSVVVGMFLGLLVVALGAGIVMACLPAAKTEAPKAAAPSVKTEEPKAEPKKDVAPSVPTMNVNDLPSAH